MGSRHKKFIMMKVCIIAVLIIGLYIGAEAQRGGRGGNGGRVGGRPGGRVGGGRGKWNKGPRKGLGELCDTDLDELECEDGQWPRLFKGSACEDINDGDQFPNWKIHVLMLMSKSLPLVAMFAVKRVPIAIDQAGKNVGPFLELRMELI